MSDASSATPPAIVDLVDDGMTDEEIAARTEGWLERVMATPGSDVGESAAEALEACERDGDLWPT